MQAVQVCVSCIQGRNDGGGKGHISPGVKSLWGRRMTAGAPTIPTMSKLLFLQHSTFSTKRPNNVLSTVQKYSKYQQCTFFNTVHLLPNDLRLEHGGAELASCPRHYLTLLRPCLYQRTCVAWLYRCCAETSGLRSRFRIPMKNDFSHCLKPPKLHKANFKFKWSAMDFVTKTFHANTQKIHLASYCFTNALFHKF